MKKVLLGMSALLVSAASFANYGLEVKVGVNGGARFKQSVSIEDYVANYSNAKDYTEAEWTEAIKKAEEKDAAKESISDEEKINLYRYMVKVIETKIEKVKADIADPAKKDDIKKNETELERLEKKLAAGPKSIETDLENTNNNKDYKTDGKIDGKRELIGSAEVTVYKKLSASEDFDVKVGGGLEGGIIKMKDQKSKFFVSPYVSGEISKEVKEDIKVFGGVNLGTYHYFGNLKKINVKAEGFVGASYKDMYNVQLSAGTLKHVSLGVSARLGF